MDQPKKQTKPRTTRHWAFVCACTHVSTPHEDTRHCNVVRLVIVDIPG